jgi:hypothetical protein
MEIVCRRHRVSDGEFSKAPRMNRHYTVNLLQNARYFDTVKCRIVKITDVGYQADSCIFHAEELCAAARYSPSR